MGESFYLTRLVFDANLLSVAFLLLRLTIYFWVAGECVINGWLYQSVYMSTKNNVVLAWCMFFYAVGAFFVSVGLSTYLRLFFVTSEWLFILLTLTAVLTAIAAHHLRDTFIKKQVEQAKKETGKE